MAIVLFHEQKYKVLFSDQWILNDYNRCLIARSAMSWYSKDKRISHRKCFELTGILDALPWTCLRLESKGGNSRVLCELCFVWGKRHAECKCEKKNKINKIAKVVKCALNFMRLNAVVVQSHWTQMDVFLVLRSNNKTHYASTHPYTSLDFQNDRFM